MTRKIRDSLYLETKDMTNEELIEMYSRPAIEVEKKPKKRARLKAA